MSEEITIGSLVAKASYGGMWLYRVTGETPRRWKVEIAKKPEGRSSWSSGPASGRFAPYFDKSARLLCVRDDAHFAVIVAAYAEREQARDEAQNIYRAACDAADEAYQSAIA